MNKGKARKQQFQSQNDLSASLEPGSADQVQVRQIPRITKETFAEYEDITVSTDPFYHNRKVIKQNREIELHLLGILYRTANAQALINGQVVTVGDAVEGYEITEITNEFVALTKNGKKFTLRPKKESS